MALSDSEESVLISGGCFAAEVGSSRYFAAEVAMAYGCLDKCFAVWSSSGWFVVVISMAPITIGYHCVEISFTRLSYRGC